MGVKGLSNMYQAGPHSNQLEALETGPACINIANTGK